jgi:hypothetical protein
MSAIGGLKRAEWICAAEQLVRMSASQVACPECGENALQVRDMEYGVGPCRGLERYLLCANCGCFNAVNLRHARALVAAPLNAAK